MSSVVDVTSPPSHALGELAFDHTSSHTAMALGCAWKKSWKVAGLCPADVKSHICTE